MPLAPPSVATVAPVTREAESRAVANWGANLAALADAQPALLARLERGAVDVTWLYARDGALTAQDSAGGWWAGCSVPAAAAKAMLKTLGGSGAVACFLRPPSAAAMRVALDKLRANQAIVAIIPDPAAACTILHCENFAADIHAHRLWLAAGEDWESQLATILRASEGLPTPAQFVRLTDGAEDLSEAMIEPAQRVFSDITQHRAAAIGRLLESVTATMTHAVTEAPPHATAGACIIAPSHFRLWDDGGHSLAQLAGKLGWPHVDPDDPASASPLAMARAAAGCAAVIMPNTGRADLPNVIAMSTPWITWLTAPRVPAFAPAGPRDVLLVADPAWRNNAIAAGWPASRLHVATWPDAQCGPAIVNGPLLICADVPSLDAPKDIIEMSSHRLLWDAIADELMRDPFALGDSILDYLRARMKQLGIAENALDACRFIDGVIAPAYARGLAELLRRNGLPLRLAGDGWDAVESLQRFATGPVATREAFEDSIAACAALVHVWPTTSAHPIHHASRPVVNATRGREPFLRDARAAVAGKLAMVPPSPSPLTARQLAMLTESAP